MFFNARKCWCVEDVFTDQPGRPALSRLLSKADGENPAAGGAPRRNLVVTTSSTPDTNTLLWARPTTTLVDGSHGTNNARISGSQAICMQNFGHHNALHVGDNYRTNGGMIVTGGHVQIYNSSQVRERSSSPSFKVFVITAVIFVDATQQVLGALIGNAIENFTTGFVVEALSPQEGSETKFVKTHLFRLIESIKSVVERDDPSIRQALRRRLVDLLGELCQITEQSFVAASDPVGVETLSCDITWRVRLFLFVLLMTGHISPTKAVELVKKRIAEVQRSPVATASRQSAKDLPCARAAYDDYISSDNRRVSCLEGTRKALLEELGEWISESETGIFVLFGLAGIGKSTIAQTVAERADNVQLLGASFFFSRNEAERRTGEVFFTTIALQLCLHDTEFAEAIDKVIKTDPGKRATKKHPLEQLETLILEPLRNLARRTVVIVIDALDQCDESDGPVILQGLNRLVQCLPSFKVILTTRPQPHLQFLLNDQHKVFHLHNIEDKIVDGDIERYFRHKLSLEQVRACLPNLRDSWTASDDEIKSLVHAAGRLFIIASTAILFILDKTSTPTIRMKVLRMALDQGCSPLNKLNDFYTAILRNAVPKDCESDTANLYQTVIGAIVLLQQPLPISALAELVDIQVNEITTVLGNLQAIILLGDNDIPVVYHRSFPDYIQDPARCRDNDLHLDPRLHHTRMAIHCLRLLNRHLKENILDLGDLACFMDNDNALRGHGLEENRVQEKIPLELQYPCLYFANHIESADIEDAELAEGLQLLLNEHFPNWLEALSWIRKLDSAHTTLLALQKQLPTSSDLHQLVADGLRFVGRFYGLIKRSALHTYHSALPFTPTETSLYKRYSKFSKTVSLCRVEGGQKAWDGLIVALDYRRLKVAEHVIFSSNTLLACIMHDSIAKRNCIITHDAVAGVPIGMIEGQVITIASDFSKAAAFDDGLTMLYNVAGFEPVATIKPSATVVKLALSHDGSRLLAGLDNGTIDLWDTGTCKQIESFVRWEKKTGVIFSPDGTRAFFGSCDDAVKLLDGENGKIVADLTFPGIGKSKLMFSGDGSRLACLTDSTLNVCTRDGASIGTAEEVAHSMAISTDGFLIATGKDGRLKLWSGNNLALLKTLDLDFKIWSLAIQSDLIGIASYWDDLIAIFDIHSGALVARLPFKAAISLAFSPDCTRLAAGSLSGVVHLFDIPSITASDSTLQKLSRPFVLAFSPDCSHLASGHDDGTVRLWDTFNMAQIAAHKGHSKSVYAFAYSDDGGKFASWSRDGIVQLWNGKDGAPDGEVKCSTELTTVALSSSILAAATEASVTLWDLETHSHIVTLDQKFTRHLAISHHHSLLAAVGFTHPATLILWDIAQHKPIAKFNLEKIPRKMRFLPNNPQLAIWDGSFRLFNPHDHSQSEVSHTQAISRLGLCPCWRGIPVWVGWPLGVARVVGRFPHLEEVVQVLDIPGDLRLARTAEGSCMIALGCEDGRILLIKTV